MLKSSSTRVWEITLRVIIFSALVAIVWASYYVYTHAGYTKVDDVTKYYSHG